MSTPSASLPSPTPRERTRHRRHEPRNVTVVQLSTIYLNLSASSAYFQWQLPMHTPITLYLPRAPRLDGWTVMRCSGRTLSSQCTCCINIRSAHAAQWERSAGSDTGDSRQYYEVWHLLGLQTGANRLELQYRLPSDSDWDFVFLAAAMVQSSLCWAEGAKWRRMCDVH